MELRERVIALSGERAEKDNLQKGLDAYTLPVEDFAKTAEAFKKMGGRLVAEWTTDDRSYGGGFSIYAAYHKDSEYLIVWGEIPAEDPSFPTLTGSFVSAYRFERQIMSLMGVRAEGHPDPRPWIKFEDWPEGVYPLRKDFDEKSSIARVEGRYDFIKAEGEGTYEIPVGPVHAGIIEPGHFRFQVAGEEIINLEERLGYVHKGIERRFESLSCEEGVRLAGRVSGDSTVAHAIAYSMAIESIAATFVPERAMWLRALMLERERIANHLGDIGAISNDVAFAFLQYQFGILRERVLRINMELFGHRLMMDKVMPGGVAVDIDSRGRDRILLEMDQLTGEFERLVRIYEDNPSLQERVYDAGTLSPSIAKDLGVVGFVARGSGQRTDVRLQRPFPPYDRLVPKITVLNSGDVHARAWVRVEEVRESIRLIREILRMIPDGKVTVKPLSLRQEGKGFAAVEGWRGEIVYWIHTGPGGEIRRCMVRDPSSVNWIGIEYAVRGNMVPDFPLCNKSFNQSYSGHDL